MISFRGHFFHSDISKRTFSHSENTHTHTQQKHKYSHTHTQTHTPHTQSLSLAHMLILSHCQGLIVFVPD